MNDRDVEVLILGCGAAGLAAAAEAASLGARVLVLEKNSEPALKIRISGGGRCNLTTTLGPSEAEPLFGREGGRFLRSALRRTSSRTIRAWVEEQGVPTVVEDFGKVFPASGKAEDVARALVARAREAGAGIRLRTRALAVEKIGSPMGPGPRWRVLTAADECLRARTLILAVGGCSYPKTGTVGEGFSWLRSLGVGLVEPHPALAPLEAEGLSPLAGITLKECEAQIRGPSGKILLRRRRPLLFTHRGLSGPAAMDLCSCLERALGSRRVVIDLCPGVPEDVLLTTLFRKGGDAARTLQRELDLPLRLVRHLLEIHGLPGKPLPQFRKEERRGLCRILKRWDPGVRKSLGFTKAESTGGGVRLEEVDPETMELLRFPGLHVTGELLDVDGPIGGFSFWIAFATGAAAGRGAALSLRG